MFERMHNAKVTCDELRAFYSSMFFFRSYGCRQLLIALIARAAIEDEYARKLLALCRKPLGSVETGTLRASLDVVRGETESIGKAHSAVAAQMRTELEEPLAAFAGGMKERRKIVQAGIERLLKMKMQQTQAVNKVGPYDVQSYEKSISLFQFSLGIDTSRTASESRVIWHRDIW